MKFKSIAEILIWSENWQSLADWYQLKVSADYRCAISGTHLRLMLRHFL